MSIKIPYNMGNVQLIWGEVGKYVHIYGTKNQIVWLCLQRWI